MKIYNLLLTCFFLSLLGCQPASKHENADTFFAEIDKFRNTDKNWKASLIVPLDGCSGCIDRSVEFLQKNYNNNELLFIVSTTSRKNAEIKLGQNLLNLDNVFVDVGNRSKKLGIISSYPVLCYFKENQVNETRELVASSLDKELISLERNLGIKHPQLTTEDEFFYYDEVDVKPEFSGGLQEFYLYIKENYSYPKKAIDEGIEGRVLIEFLINTQGEVKKVQIVNGLGTCCDSSIEDLILASPPWTPGYKDKVPVNTVVMIPIVLKLPS